MYTKEEEEFLRSNYPKLSIEQIATHLDKSPRSIVGKLSRLGIYQRKVYLNKRGERPTTKLEICARIAQVINLSPEELEGLSKAPKEVLLKLVKTLERGDTLDEI